MKDSLFTLHRLQKMLKGVLRPASCRKQDMMPKLVVATLLFHLILTALPSQTILNKVTVEDFGLSGKVKSATSFHYSDVEIEVLDSQPVYAGTVGRQYFFNKLGNIVKDVNHQSTSHSPVIRLFEYEAEGQNRLLSTSICRDPNLIDCKVSSQITYEDNSSNYWISMQIEPDSMQVFYYILDDSKRIKEVYRYEQDALSDLVARYKYDRSGNVVNQYLMFLTGEERRKKNRFGKEGRLKRSVLETGSQSKYITKYSYGDGGYRKEVHSCKNCKSKERATEYFCKYDDNSNIIQEYSITSQEHVVTRDSTFESQEVSYIEWKYDYYE